MPRRLFLLALLLPTVALRAQPAELAVTFRNACVFPGNLRTTDQDGKSFQVAELSGLTWLGGDTWLAIADKGNHVVEFAIPLARDGGMEIEKVRVVRGFTLRGAIHDYEGIAYTGPGRNTIYVSEEDTPGVHEFSLTTWRELDGPGGSPLPVPTIFKRIRGNRGFESLTLRADGKELWTANEEALTVDGPASSPRNGTWVRLLRYTIETKDGAPAATPTQQYAYLVSPVHATQTGRTAPQSGLTDLAMLPNGRLLALERSAVWNPNPLKDMAGPPEVPGFRCAIYEVDLSRATDVSRLAGLAGPARDFTPASKRELWSQAGTLDNFEGLGLGPRTAGGRALLTIMDNNSSRALGTKLAAFELSGPIGAVETLRERKED